MNRIQFLPSRATAFIWKDKCILKVSRLAPKPGWDPALTVAFGAALLRIVSSRGNNLRHQP